MSEILQAKITSVRRKQVSVATSTGLAAAVAAFCLVLAASMLLDFWLNLSFTSRAALLAIDLAVVVWILLYGIFAPILYGPDDDEIALLVEDAEPAFRTRLIASVQLSRAGAAPAGASTSLVRAMIAQAEALAGPMDFARVIKTDRLVRIVIAALFVLIAGGAAFAWGGESSKVLLKRALFLSQEPVPRKTRVVSVTADLLIARGDNVEILAIADGVYPPEDRRKLFIKTLPDDKSQSDRKQDFNLEPLQAGADRLEQVRQAARASGRDGPALKPILDRLGGDPKDAAPLFAATIENVQESFEYTVRLNDGESQTFKCRVLPRPAITRVEAKQVYPTYTGRPVEPRALGDLALLRGSKLQLAITVNKNLRRPGATDARPNFVHLIGAGQDLPLAVDAKNASLLTGEIDAPKGTTGFSINLTDEHGLKSKDPAVYRIDLIEDKPPVVRIILPVRKEVLLVREAKHRVIFEATDDFAIGNAAIKYKVDDGPEASIKLDLKGNPRSFRGEYNWKLNEIQVTSAAKPTLEGSVIEYWVEVADTKDAPNGGPGRGVSDHYMVRVVSEAEKRAEMAARIADIGSGLRTAADDQEAVANKVQTILLEKKTEEPSPK